MLLLKKVGFLFAREAKNIVRLPTPRRRGRLWHVMSIKLRPAMLLSLVATLLLIASAAAQTAPGAPSGPIWVRPIKETVVVYTHTGAKVERIAVLTEDTIVQVLAQDPDWYQVKFTTENAEFVGWVLKAEMAVEGTPANPPKRTPKPEPRPKPEKPEKTEPEKKTLSIEETHKKLLALVQIPVSEAPKYTKSYNLEGMKDSITVRGSTGMSLFGGYKAKMEVMELFPPDEVIEAYIEDEKIAKLEGLWEEAHPAFHRVIDYYIRALEAYLERKNNFLRLINSAERFWKRIPGIDVGF